MLGSKIRFMASALLFGTLIFTGACRRGGEAGITKEHADSLTEAVMRIWNSGALDLVDGLYAPGYVRHHPTPTDAVDLDAFKATVEANRTVFPDYQLAFDEIIIHGDRLLVFARVTGTNTGVIEGRPATGRDILMEGIYIYRIENALIAEEWTFFNLLSYYQQLGFALNPPTPPDR